MEFSSSAKGCVLYDLLGKLLGQGRLTEWSDLNVIPSQVYADFILFHIVTGCSVKQETNTLMRTIITLAPFRNANKFEHKYSESYNFGALLVVTRRSAYDFNVRYRHTQRLIRPQVHKTYVITN